MYSVTGEQSTHITCENNIMIAVYFSLSFRTGIRNTIIAVVYINHDTVAT